MPVEITGPCKRCNAEACIVARQEPLCRDCFMNYVRTKAVKRMESYASRNQRRRLLLPVSFGVSSTTLLSLLHGQLERQRNKTGRTGFTLHVLFVDTSVLEPGVPDVQRLQQLRDAFPGHEYSSVQLDLTRELDLDLDSLSLTARADLLSILRRRLAVRFALANNCTDVLWGDSTTNLAARALAETAKGRGFALPWLVADAVSPSGIAFRYPLQDVYKTELVAYAQSSPLDQLIHPDPVHVAVSAKHTTIDALMRHYFDSVQPQYPAIVANVARTSSRLEPASAADPQCRLCHMPVAGGRFGIHAWPGQHDSTHPRPNLCYGCERSTVR